MTVIFDWVDDETCKIWCGGNVIMTLTHDEDGWAGMERVITALKSLCDFQRIVYLEKGDPNV